MTKRRAKVPAIIVSSEASNWGSCRIITPNLEKAYQNLLKEKCNYFGYTVYQNLSQILALAEEIAASQPSRLIFIDHIPHPDNLLEALTFYYPGGKLPPIDFHVYGDFTLYTGRWRKLEKLLKKTKVHFLCASIRQRNLISSFMKEKEAVTSVCPFPVDPQSYFYSEEKRAEVRARLGLKEQDKMFLYTGRISLQKNVLRLTREILKFFAQHPERKIYFYLAGAFDNIGAPFFGVNPPPHFYYKEWQKLLEQLPEKYRDRIRYVGQLGSKDLHELYLAADLYLSLSTHHDEDYGMSPIEALCSGCPVLLSSWGGYTSFALEESSTQLVPVKITAKGLTLSSESFQKKLELLMNQKETSELKSHRSQLHQDKFSIGAVQEILTRRGLYTGLFKGFSKNLTEHARLFESYRNNVAPFSRGPIKNSFYYDVYRHYTGQ